jgi:leucyl aminopeptidase
MIEAAMTDLTPISFIATEVDSFATRKGRVAVIVSPDGKLEQSARRVNRLTKGAVQRFVDSDGFAKVKPGHVMSLAWPVGMEATAVDVICLGRTHTQDEARKAGAALAKLRGTGDMLLAVDGARRVADIGFGLAMRDYAFIPHKTDAKSPEGEVVVMCTRPDEAAAAAAPLMAVAEGTFMTRDLVNEPANILTTTEFANRLEEMKALGLTVEVLDEAELEKLGMRTLLCVGQGSDSPSKVVVMQWNGGADGAAPLALVGKGVVFDTGGISLKPAAGMEDMTMDMGGAGVVAGTMRALARRKAKANVVGLVGLVENMPSGNATRPGDVVTSMKGDTVEVINTDAEGRLVLCDVMWYAQERFAPAGMIDLATLTGAIIIGLGHENAGVFSNDDALCNAFLKAAGAEGEGAWRMPLGEAYDDMLKSRIADMKNIGGRPAGSVTAAQFLQRFVKPETPWIHLDIAGVASVKSDTTLAPKGATGWGVMALNRLVADHFES